MDEHRSRYAIVIASRFRSTPGSAYDRLIQQDLRDEDEVALADGIEERADVIVEASSYSKLTGIALEELAAASVREVHVVGIDTDQCVLATVLTAFDENYDPWVFTDLCGSAAGSDPHEAGLLVLRRAIGDERVVPRP